MVHADGTPQSGGYDLFHPTPSELRRPLDPERPDLTQNATTVDAGVVQIETGFFEYTDDAHRITSDTFESWSVLTDQKTEVRRQACGVLRTLVFRLLRNVRPRIPAF